MENENYPKSDKDILKYLLSKGLGITLKNNEIKDTIKVIRSLKKRDFSLKGTAEKVLNEERVFLCNVLGPLMKFSLPLMKNVLASLATNVLMPLGLTAVLSITDTEIQRKFMNHE